MSPLCPLLPRSLALPAASCPLLWCRDAALARDTVPPRVQVTGGAGEGAHGWCGAGLRVLPSRVREGICWGMLVPSVEVPGSSGHAKCRCPRAAGMLQRLPGRWEAAPHPSQEFGWFAFPGVPLTAFSLCRSDHGLGHQPGPGLPCCGAGEPHRWRLGGAASASPLLLASTGTPAAPAPVRLQNGACPSLSPPVGCYGEGRRAGGAGLGGAKLSSIPPTPALPAQGMDGGGGRWFRGGDGGVVLGTCKKEGPDSAPPLQVIRPEPCGVCGSRIRFGKAAVKCRQCQLLLHPKCQEQCPSPCAPRPRHHAWPREVRGGMAALGGCSTSPWGCRDIGPGTWGSARPSRRAQSGSVLSPPQGVLADFAPPTPPLVPALVVQCVNVVETRGLTEVGAGVVGVAMPGSPRG